MYDLTKIARLETSLLDCFTDDLTLGKLIDQAILNLADNLSYEQVVQAWNRVMPMLDTDVAGCTMYPDIIEAHGKIKKFQQDILSKPDAEQ